MKTGVLHTRVSETDKARWQAAADKNRMSLTAWLSRELNMAAAAQAAEGEGEGERTPEPAAPKAPAKKVYIW